MAFPRIVPHSDGAGTVDAVGAGVDPARVGRRVWVWGAQSCRPSGTAAQCTVVPADSAVDLPDGVGDELGAYLGIPGITAHRAVFGDGPVPGDRVLVHGVLGGMDSLAAQLACWTGATVVGTVRRSADLARVDPAWVPHAVALDIPDVVDRIRAVAPDGVDRVVEVSLPGNATSTSPSWPSAGCRPSAGCWPPTPAAAKRQAAAHLTAVAADGALGVPVAAVLPLDEIAAAHDRVGAGAAGRVLLARP